MKVRGRSMMPTLKEGDYLLVNRWEKRYSVNDIVVAKSANMNVVKRIRSISNGKILLTGDNSAESRDVEVGSGAITGKMVLRI